MNAKNNSSKLIQNIFMTLALSLISFSNSSQALSLGGCWKSVQVEVRDDRGIRDNCPNDMMDVEIRTGANMIDLKKVAFDCNQKAPMLGELKPMKVENSKVFQNGQEIGSVDANSVKLNLQDTVAEMKLQNELVLGTETAPNERQLSYQQTYKLDGDLIFTLKGRLEKVDCQ